MIGWVAIQLIMLDLMGNLTSETTSSKSKTSLINSFHTKLGTQQKWKPYWRIVI